MNGAPEGGPYEWWQRAVELLERTVAVESGSASSWEALGRASYDAGQIQRAAEAFTKLVELAPDSHYGHFALGLSLTRLDRFERGVEHLAMASTMRPERPEYADRLRQARATLRARQDAAQAAHVDGGADSAVDGGMDGGPSESVDLRDGRDD